MTGAPIVARTSSPDDTRELAATLARAMVASDLVLLVGDLGSGKTTFTQGLARGLGVIDPVTSPTFTLLRAYPCRPGPIRTLLHADLYRLDTLSDVLELGISEMVEDDSVAVVEWGDMAPSVFGPDLLTVSLVATPAGERWTDQERTVTFLPEGTWNERRPALAAALAPWTTVDPGPGGTPSSRTPG